MKEVFIVSAVRTPMGSFMGSLSGVPATQLGTAAVKGALDKINLDPALVQEIYMGMFCRLAKVRLRQDKSLWVLVYPIIHLQQQLIKFVLPE